MEMGIEIVGVGKEKPKLLLDFANWVMDSQKS